MTTDAVAESPEKRSFLRSPHTWESLEHADCSDDDFFQALDFQHFNCQQHCVDGDSEDFIQLRAALAKRPNNNSSFELHKRCFKAIRERVELKERNGCFSFDLVTNFVHAEPIGCFAMSPCKVYIAVATHCGGDYHGGGSIQIFEISTGQAVNQAYGGIEGGIGWSGHARMLQWIPEEGNKGTLAYCYHTNGFGFCDPTGDMQYPEIECFPLDGKDEPCPFTFSPDGTFAIGFGCNEAGIPGGTTDGDDEIEHFEDEVPDHLKNEDGEAPEMGSWEYMMFADGGKRLQGTTLSSAIAVDMESRKLMYAMGGVGGCSAWTQDGHLFAYSSPHLTIRNAATGEMIREFPEFKGASELSWAVVSGQKSGVERNAEKSSVLHQQYRLAMVVGGRYDPNYSSKDEAVLASLGAGVQENLRKAKQAKLESKPAGVYVFDVSMKQQEFLCQLPTSTGFPTRNFHFADKNLWSWSPCGKMGAAVDKTATVQIWKILEGPKDDAETPAFQKLSEFTVSESTLALGFGKDSSVVTIAEHSLEFWNAKEGTLIRRIDRAQFTAAFAELSPVGASAMRVGDKDFSSLDPYSLDTDKFSLLPIFDQASNAFHVCAIRKGALLCHGSMLDEAMKHCHFVFNRSHSWPLEWCEFKVYDSLRDIIDDPLFPLPEDSRDKVRLAAQKPTTMPQVKSLANEDTSITPYTFVESWLETKEKEIEKEQGRGILPGQLYDIALVCINEGQTGKALEVAMKIKPIYVERTSALCDAATILLTRGQTEDAKPFVLEANSSLESFKVDKYTNLSFLYAPFMAMAFAQGEEAQAKSFETKARHEMDNENNPGEKYRCLARSFFLVERFGAAAKVLGEGRRKIMNYGKIVSIFLRSKKADNDAVFGLLNIIVKNATSPGSARFSSSQNIAMAISQCFSNRGEHDKALELMKDHDRLFKNISTVEAEIDVIRRLTESQEEAKAIDSLDERIRRCRPYKSSLSRWLRALVELELHNKYPTDLLNELIGEMESAIPAELSSRYTGPARFIEDLSWVEGRLGREKPYLEILKQSVTPEFQHHAYLGLLRGSKSAPDREAIHSAIQELVQDKPTTFGSLLTLAHAAHALEKKQAMESYFEEAAKMASQNDDPRDKLRQVMQYQLKAGDLSGAYKTWRRVVPNDRAYVGKEFLEALMEAKHYAGVKQYIEQLPSTEDRMSATFSALCLSYHGSTDDVRSWR